MKQNHRVEGNTSHITKIGIGTQQWESENDRQSMI
jgi:hypothetical protein